MKKSFDVKTHIITFTFAPDSGLSSQTIDVDGLTDEIREHAMCDRVMQKVGDNAATAKTEAERSTAVAAMIRQLVVDKTWNAKHDAPKSAAEIARLTAENAVLMAELAIFRAAQA